MNKLGPMTQTMQQVMKDFEIILKKIKDIPDEDNKYIAITVFKELCQNFSEAMEQKQK